jgi:SAM-dependent methyltransferase
MSELANREQADAWNGESGHRWVATADRRDAVLAPVGSLLVTPETVRGGARVLDVGCGCGATTLMAAARVGTRGRAVGIDLSAPMLGVARCRAVDAKQDRATFVRGDAQVHRFETSSVDLVISRFGTMFFSDPIAAFRNIASAMRPDAELRFATWQPLSENEWLTVPGAALLRHTELRASSVEGPGMFAQSDPEAISAVLHASGFTGVQIEAHDVTFVLGQTIDEAIAYLADSGPARVMLDSIPDGPARADALLDVRDRLRDHVERSGVVLRGGVWIVTGRPVLDQP